MVDFGATRNKLLSPKLSKLWAILATVSAAISYTSFISTTGGPGTGPTYERTVAGIFGATLVAIHVTVLVSTRNLIRSYIPWAGTREWNPLTMVIVMITSIIAMFLFKFPFVKLDGYTLCSVFAFTADVVFLELLVAPEYSMSFGWAYGCHMIVFLTLSAHRETRMPGYEVYHIIWFSVFTYLVGRLYFSGPVFP